MAIFKTKRGNIIKSPREHYLRDDIHCGFPSCSACLSYISVNTPNLSTSPKTKILERSVYVVVDSSVILHQLDVLLHPCMRDVILLNTVLTQVKASNLHIFNRIQEIADSERSFYTFSNEFHKQTFVKRKPEESIEDRNRNAIFSATKWLNSHISKESKQNINVLLITNDQTQKELAKSFGLAAFLLAEYVEFLKDEAPELIDMVADLDTQDLEAEKISYDDYLSTAKLQIGLKAGVFYQGKLAIAAHRLFEGSIFASIDGEEHTIKLIGRQNLNRAVHDDIVVVELLPKDQWKIAAEDIIDEDGDLEKKTVVDTENTMNEEESTIQPMDTDEVLTCSPVGKVVGIVRRNWRAYCGTIDAKSVSKSLAQQSVWFYPVDKRVPRIRIRTRQANQLLGHRVIVSIDAWDRKSMYPRGHFVKKLGSSGDKATEMEVLLLEHDVSYQPFSEAVLSSLPEEGDKWVVSNHHFEGRADFRDLNICSIDPPGCTDIDDALHCRALENGNFEVGVHIADVTHFVKPNTAMDIEASKRGTTVYLVDNRIDMLPPLLGTNLCSLRSNVERLAFSCVWELSPKAEIITVRYTKSVIRSKASFTYAEAQLRIDDSKLNDDLTKSIRNLNMLAKQLKSQRQEQGSLTLSSAEVRFQLEHDSQDPIDIELKQLTETNSLVEEFMLLANISVARKIYERFPETAVLRRHPKPPQTNFEGLKKALQQYQLELNTDTSKLLADSLDVAQTSNDEYFNKLVRIMTTRCMMQAVYFCSGTLANHDFWHYGLATEIYTHFTSPIRRYSDVMVHRLLEASITPSDLLINTSLLDRVKIMEVCENLNYRHRMAQQASRSSVELYTNLYFRGKVVEESGYVTKVLKNGFSALVPKYGIEGFVYVRDQNVEVPFEFDADKQELIFGEVKLRMFSRVKVQISIDDSSISGLRQRLSMCLLSPFVPGLSVVKE